MEKFKSVDNLISQLKPSGPVYCIRRNSIQVASKYFQKKFPGKILYAVKTNPNPVVLDAIINSGINEFDVASIKEIQQIKKIKPDDLEDFDIICAGFPCQPFSNAGKKQTFSDDRGLLFDEVIRLAKAKKPRFMFLENVKHILKVSESFKTFI